MVSASAPDLDGLSLLGGWECYYDWHHVLMHNLPFAVILAALLACFSRPKLTAFAVYFGLVHLHFALDLLGSGSDWGVDYWRPFSPVSIRWSAGWEYLSWQNYLAAFACIAAAIGIIYWKKRTILEYPMPKLNRELVDFFLKLARRHG